MNDGIRSVSPHPASTFVSPVSAWPTATQITQWAHALGRVPTWVRIVYVCNVPEYGYFQGEEADIAGSDSRFSADANCISAYIATGGAAINRKDTPGVGATLTASRWGLKCYAS